MNEVTVSEVEGSLHEFGGAQRAASHGTPDFAVIRLPVSIQGFDLNSVIVGHLDTSREILRVRGRPVEVEIHAGRFVVCACVTGRGRRSLELDAELLGEFSLLTHAGSADSVLVQFSENEIRVLEGGSRSVSEVNPFSIDGGIIVVLKHLELVVVVLTLAVAVVSVPGEGDGVLSLLENARRIKLVRNASDGSSNGVGAGDTCRG